MARSITANAASCTTTPTAPTALNFIQRVTVPAAVLRFSLFILECLCALRVLCGAHLGNPRPQQQSAAAIRSSFSSAPVRSPQPPGQVHPTARSRLPYECAGQCNLTLPSVPKYRLLPKWKRARVSFRGNHCPRNLPASFVLNCFMNGKGTMRAAQAGSTTQIGRSPCALCGASPHGSGSCRYSSAVCRTATTTAIANIPAAANRPSEVKQQETFARTPLHKDSAAAPNSRSPTKSVTPSAQTTPAITQIAPACKSQGNSPPTTTETRLTSPPPLANARTPDHPSPPSSATDPKISTM